MEQGYNTQNGAQNSGKGPGFALAVVSLALGIYSLAGGSIAAGIAAIITGSIAINKGFTGNMARVGKNLGIAGLIVTAVMTLIVIVGMIAAFAVMTPDFFSGLA